MNAPGAEGQGGGKGVGDAQSPAQGGTSPEGGEEAVGGTEGDASQAAASGPGIFAGLGGKMAGMAGKAANAIGGLFSGLGSGGGPGEPASPVMMHLVCLAVIPFGLLFSNIHVCNIRTNQTADVSPIFTTTLGLFLPTMLAFAAVLIFTQVMYYITGAVSDNVKYLFAYILVTAALIGLSFLSRDVTQEVIIIDLNVLWIALYIMIYTFKHWQCFFLSLWPMKSMYSQRNT